MLELSKEYLGLAGEYLVASELCRRGVYAQLTKGHHKRTDILVETEYKMLRIQVKAKQGREWPSVEGIYRDDDILMLVDYEKRHEYERPEIFILDLDDWEKLLDEEKVRFPGIEIDKKKKVTYPDGYIGLNIKPFQVDLCKDRWEKILSRIHADECL